jgi:beta-N-acetylhexosaminidase
VPESYLRAMREGRRGGAILFKQNVEGGPLQVAAACRALHEASSGPPPLVCIDQEGGRVARLRAPLIEVPPMRTVASWGDEGLAERIARLMGDQLAALGMTVDFAPVLDVNTCAANPVIGDRAFGEEPQVCARFGIAWARGLQSAGLLACGKHFPGHGDTSKDSHIDLPVVEQPRERLERVELEPFRAASAAGVALLMTAHVVYTALDPNRPGTLSPAVCTALREQIAFDGVLVSDDLEMRAIAARWDVADAAVAAVAAGCDALLVCWTDALQEQAVAALEREASRSSAFRARCEQAHARILKARARITAGPATDEAIRESIEGAEAQALRQELARRVAP